MSPRTTVRVAAVDAYGDVLNEYTGTRRITGAEPDRPWAVYLAGPDGLFRLLCFDLDSKTPAAAAAAARDAGVLAGLIVDVGLQPVVCASGPSGGRHVWTGLAEGVDAETVATLARLAKHLCPTLDLSPLSNAATGCVRPPGAPHRAGGHSTVLSGELDALTEPTGTAAQVRALTERVAQLVEHAEPVRVLQPSGSLPVDDDGHVHIDGPKRHALPAFGRTALDEAPGARDASSILWSVLLAAAAAGWRHADVAALVDTAPGFEHARTYQNLTGRHSRPRYGDKSTAGVLRRQWDKAVRYVAGTARTIGGDPTFVGRAGAIAAHTLAVQTRADATGGRWNRGGGPADRRILDALCVVALQAVSAAVEADTRRLALMAGVGRETARTALLRLSEDGWIARVRSADGAHGAHWTIDPQNVIPRVDNSSRSQADPPPGVGGALRISLLETLTARLTAAAHDLFTLGRPALGHHAGNTYARTAPVPQTLDELARSVGASRTQTARTLYRLNLAGLVVEGADGWRRPDTDSRDMTAERIGIAGRLADRARRYTVERELWAWWRDEEEWMRSPHRPTQHRRPAPDQISLFTAGGRSTRGAHPRRIDGRADLRTARAYVEGRAFEPSSQPTAVTDATRIVVDILGARFIGVELIEPRGARDEPRRAAIRA